MKLEKYSHIKDILDFIKSTISYITLLEVGEENVNSNTNFSFNSNTNFSFKRFNIIGYYNFNDEVLHRTAHDHFRMGFEGGYLMLTITQSVGTEPDLMAEYRTIHCGSFLSNYIDDTYTITIAKYVEDILIMMEDTYGVPILSRIDLYE